MAMRYPMKPLTAPLGGKILTQHFYLKNGARYGKKVNDKLIQYHRFTTRKCLAHKYDNVIYYNTRAYTWQMHAIFITCTTKLVDDMGCAIPFSSSIKGSFGMHIA